MSKFEIIIPTLFGLEALTAREVRRMGYETTRVEDGRVTFSGDEQAVCRANINIRTGERVLIKLGEFNAESFTELFDGVYALPWEEWIDRHGAFPVKGSCLKSRLASVPDCQAIIKKAAAKRLGERYGEDRLPEDGALCRIQFSLMKNRVTVMLDTSGEPLHKRGYRKHSNTAPLRETIAAAMVMLSRWKYEEPLCDPFCGSGTIPIEAAMFKNSIAPGLMRSFAAERFGRVDGSMWKEAREEAEAARRKLPLEIYASDTDAACAELTRANAEAAGVGGCINVSVRDAAKLSPKGALGAIICNPPYGERMSSAEECGALYGKMGQAFERLSGWSKYIIAPDGDFERLYGRRADKKRKIYNGMIRCNIYQYFPK